MNIIKIIPKKISKQVIIILMICFVFELILFPVPVLANNQTFIQKISSELSELIESSMAKISHFSNNAHNKLPSNPDKSPIKTTFHTITAYNSDPKQTDSTPCITANNFDVCNHGIEDTVAANFLPFGSKIKIPDLFGDKIFIVRDRMNKRYTSRVDIWMKEFKDARKFGKKTAKIELISYH